MTTISEHEKFLYNHFELLFSKEQPSSDDARMFRLENRFIIKNSTIPEQDTESEQNEYFKIEFDKLRETIDEIIKAEEAMTGGNISSLKYIKKYINDKIDCIIPRD